MPLNFERINLLPKIKNNYYHMKVQCTCYMLCRLKMGERENERGY